MSGLRSTYSRCMRSATRRPTGVLMLCSSSRLLAPVLVAAPATAATGRVRGAIVGRRRQEPEGQGLVVRRGLEVPGRAQGERRRLLAVLPAGTYHLQFTDQRPAYDVEQVRPADVTVTVATARPRSRTSRWHAAPRSAAPCGRRQAAPAARGSWRPTRSATPSRRPPTAGPVRARRAPAGHATRSSPTTSARPVRRQERSTCPSSSRRSSSGSQRPASGSRPAGSCVDLYAGDQPYPGVAFVTAVSRENGQFWTEKAAHGTVTFGGLYPGKYDLVVPGVGGYLGGTLSGRRQGEEGQHVVRHRPAHPGRREGRRRGRRRATTPHQGASAPVAIRCTTARGPGGRRDDRRGRHVRRRRPAHDRAPASRSWPRPAADPPYLQGDALLQVRHRERPGVASRPGQATALGDRRAAAPARTPGQDAAC